MSKLMVKYARDKCIGAKKCIEVAPGFFTFKDGKADLINYYLSENQQTIVINAVEEQINSLKSAAELCPVNAIHLMLEDKVLVSTDVNKDKIKTIIAKYDDLKEFVMDPKGYFLIRINPKKNEIEVGLCTELNKVTFKIIGKKPLEIYQTIIKNKLITRMDHAAYLGRELQKAYIALKQGISYVQDDELVL